MQLPPENAHYSQRVDFGTYVVRRLKRAKFTALATDAELATSVVKSKGRLWEDAKGPVQDALADRDAADDNLDDHAKNLRNSLAGRSVPAITEAPYKNIFPQGIGYYTAARLEDQMSRYTEFGQRVGAHLPDNDALKQPALSANSQGLSDFGAASTALTQARVQETMAKTELDATEESWNRLMEKIYGLLLSELGRKAAERFFPRVKGKAKSKDEGQGDEG